MLAIQESPELNIRETNQDKYLPPDIIVLEITPEKGFAASSSANSIIWGTIGWD
ncbi:MAG: hypothetical protein PHS38_10700 [Bacteroidales bacterium]|nr:hypothetical protein [Bacteroidales bacterium]MDD3945166.1 hypothetical protein [Bacteroidales bacterium]MDD3945169.1 hypothetical protein [Bacteroidales bacterium]